MIILRNRFFSDEEDEKKEDKYHTGRNTAIVGGVGALGTYLHTRGNFANYKEDSDKLNKLIAEKEAANKALNKLEPHKDELKKLRDKALEDSNWDAFLTKLKSLGDFSNYADYQGEIVKLRDDLNVDYPDRIKTREGLKKDSKSKLIKNLALSAGIAGAATLGTYLYNKHKNKQLDKKESSPAS